MTDELDTIVVDTLRSVDANVETEWLRATTTAPLIGVDRKAEVLRGFIVAQEGRFKSDGRGEFDLDALNKIIEFMKAAPNGLKSRFTHPDLSSDGLGKFLGRAKDPRLDIIRERDSEGTLKTNEIHVVRADLHIDPSSHKSPSGDIGGYIMDLAESDPDALSSSLVLRADKTYRIDDKGRRLKDEKDEDLPPLWMPTALHATDIVDTGDAVDGLLSTLSADGLPDAVVRNAAALMDRQFAGKPREFIRERAIAWLDRYLTRQFGPESPPYDPARDPAKLRIRNTLRVISCP